MMTSLCFFIPPWLWFLPQKRSRKKNNIICTSYIHILSFIYKIAHQDVVDDDDDDDNNEVKVTDIYANLPFVCSTFLLSVDFYSHTHVHTPTKHTFVRHVRKKTVLLLLSKKMESADEIILRSEMLKEKFCKSRPLTFFYYNKNKRQNTQKERMNKKLNLRTKKKQKDNTYRDLSIPFSKNNHF